MINEFCKQLKQVNDKSQMPNKCKKYIIYIEGIYFEIYVKFIK